MARLCPVMVFSDNESAEFLKILVRIPFPCGLRGLNHHAAAHRGIRGGASARLLGLKVRFAEEER